MASNQHVRFAHVSYRKGDRLFWTRNKVRIPAGERILTDGRHEIRARCGNRIEDSPEGEVEPEADAPLPVELVTPILEEEPIEEAQPGIPLPVPSEIVTSLDLNLAPTLQLAGDSSLFNSWQYEPALGGAVFIHPFAFTLPPYRWAIRIDPSEIPTSDPEADPQERSKRHSEVPEPSTFALFLTGAAAVLLFARPRVNLTPAVTSENAPSTTPSPD